MTVPGRTANPRGRFWPVLLARYLHNSFLLLEGEEVGSGGKVAPPPSQARTNE